VYTGLAMGSGDALIGLNPAVDTVENVGALLRQLDQLRRETGAPTQICVLGHVRTQLACLEAGAPVEILFQSLAGTERTNREEFDIDVALLDHAWEVMRSRGALAGKAPQFCYFETGQGSELTYGKHEGLDMTTAEALCHTLARRYDPFMVNNVTGFIGPETHLDDREMIVSNLQDHFMGKLLGLPMGMAPCYTLHANITLDGQQAATELLTAAGANFYMDVHLNTDRMLAYFDTSGHDDQTLRETYCRAPAPEFCDWGLARGIFAREGARIVRGPRWGDPTIFASPALLAELRVATPTYYGATHAGPRPTNTVTREVRLNQAFARRATQVDLAPERLAAVGPFRPVTTGARTRAEHLASPSAGARLASPLTPDGHALQILVADGLSAEAVHANLPDLLPLLLDGLAARGLTPGVPLLARFGRVKLAEPVAEALGADLVVVLIGERPGGDARASRSLSAYLAWRLGDGRFEYTVVSNIYEGGLPPVEAAAVLVERITAIVRNRAAGNRLEHLLAGG
jgi:ethanolamine ammonia-lyase large subunit